MGNQFWNSSQLEPKRQHRWLLQLGKGLRSYTVKTTDKPSFTINESEHDFFGHKFFYPGAVSWNEISVTLVDPVDPDQSSALVQILENAGYATPDAAGDISNPMMATVSKGKAVQALGPKINLMQYGVDRGDVIETWTLHNPWIKDVNFGSLDYGSDDLVEIELTIRYDWATYSGPNA
tara:strand:- start:1710 stop:2243 length:534 start_codon:yes stop_codon:yes gene_type:complete